jgi:competence CoiA-like predicted nuclease
MVDFNNKKAIKQVREYIYANYRLIKVKPGKCRYNFQCHSNSVHEAKKRRDKKLAMVVYIDGSTPIVHFVNYRNKKFIDNTLGQWSSQHEYYFIKWIDEPDMFYIHTIFDNYRNHLRNQLSWWVKLTSDYAG